MWLNDGVGNFTDGGQSLGNSESYSVSLGDVDADGDLDAFVVNYAFQSNRVWINDASGNFTDSGQSLGSLDSYAVSLGDLDGDGDLDGFVANGQPNRVWMNIGAQLCGPDIDGDGIPNICDIDQALGDDCDGNGEVDSCQHDTDGNGIIENLGVTTTVQVTYGRPKSTKVR